MSDLEINAKGKQPVCRPSPAALAEWSLRAPQSLNTGDLGLQLTLAVLSVEDFVFQMPDFSVANDDAVLETESNYVSKRQGRFFTRPMTANFSKSKTTIEKYERRGDILSDDDVEYQVLCQTTDPHFIPGLDHLNSTNAHSAYLQYDNDIEELYQATIAFLDERQDDESSCLNDKSNTTFLPGESFFLAGHDGTFRLSVDRLSASSIFDLIDQCVDADISFEDGRTQNNILELLEISRMGAIFNADIQQFVKYTAIDQLMKPQVGELDSDAPCSGTFSEVSLPSVVYDTDLGWYSSFLNEYSGSGHMRDDPDINDGISDMSLSDGKDDYLSRTQPTTLTYFDANTQQCVGYTAFNQLFSFSMEDAETHPRIYWEIDDFDDTDEDMHVIEISQAFPLCHDADQEVTNDETNPPCLGGPNTLCPQQAANDLALYSFDFGISSSQSSSTRKIGTLHSSKSTSRPHLSLETQLLPISEVSEEERASLDSASSNVSIGFADHRDFVRPLSIRRMDFLDDEEEEEEEEDSIDFTNHRALLRPLFTCRMNFLGDEVDEEEGARRSSSTSTNSIESASDRACAKLLSVLCLTFLDDNDDDDDDDDDDEDDLESLLVSAIPEKSPTASRPQAQDFFGDDIWATEPGLTLALPSENIHNNYIRTTLAGVSFFPESNLLDAFETEIHGLLSLMFVYTRNKRFRELSELTGDLSWVLNALISRYPGIAL